MRKVFKSKTIWFAIVLSILGAIQDNIPELKDSISQDSYGTILQCVAIVIAILRTVTTKPLSDK